MDFYLCSVMILLSKWRSDILKLSFAYDYIKIELFKTDAQLISFFKSIPLVDFCIIS
jgi:hypothetical protein